MHPLGRFMGALLALIVIATEATSARAVDSVDVFRSVRALEKDVERIRNEIGRPLAPVRKFEVRDASPRDVYFLSQAVYEKANRLTKQLLRKSRLAPRFALDRRIRAHDVLEVIVATRHRLDPLNHCLGLGDSSPLPPREEGRDSSDVYVVLYQVSRQLNLMMTTPMQPSDVFGQVSLSLSYARRLRPSSQPEIAAPPFERAKQPGDVYERLLRCFGLVSDLFKRRGFKSLTFWHQWEKERIQPGDVYDLAVLIVSELRFLHHQDGAPGAVRSHHFPGRIFPAHVFQHAGWLEGHLRALLDSPPQTNLEGR